MPGINKIIDFFLLIFYSLRAIKRISDHPVLMNRCDTIDGIPTKIFPDLY